jgi:hypothetical protein
MEPGNVGAKKTTVPFESLVHSRLKPRLWADVALRNAEAIRSVIFNTSRQGRVYADFL